MILLKFFSDSTLCIVLAIGAQVNITVYVWVSSCSEASHQNVSSPEYRDLERNIRGNVSMLYKETLISLEKSEIKNDA